MEVQVVVTLEVNELTRELAESLEDSVISGLFSRLAGSNPSISIIDVSSIAPNVPWGLVEGAESMHPDEVRQVHNAHLQSMWEEFKRGDLELNGLEQQRLYQELAVAGLIDRREHGAERSSSPTA